jgi:hypothetical protein
VGGIGSEYTIEVISKGSGNFEIEFIGVPFYEDIPTMEVVAQDTDGSVITYTQGVREAFKTDFTVTRVENTYTIGFQGKTRQLDAGPGVSLVVADTSDLTGTVDIVTRMDGINHYGIETMDVLLGSGSDIVSVQGTSQGSYDYDMGMTAVIETSTDGDSGNVPEVQRLRLNAAGTFTLTFDGETTADITVDPADLSVLAGNIEAALEALPNIDDVEVERDNDKYTITFVNPANPDEPELTIDDSNLSPVHAVTNISLGDNNHDSSAGDYDDLEHVFVSSNADLDRNTIYMTDGNADPFDFLTGNLDDISGDLNLDFGDGRHGLMISDEEATVGDDDVVITDILPALKDLNRLDTGSDIWITGLNFGGISYGVDATANLYEGVVYWTGSGDDTIHIDGTHYKPAEFRTTTMLNTGMGDDDITVVLEAGDDGFFVLNTMGGAESVDPHTSFGISEGSESGDDDYVDATLSSLPLTVFGGIGQDEINTGTGADMVFGDFGRVWYFDDEGDDETVDIIAVHGFGRRGNIISSQVVDAKLMFTVDRTIGDDDTIRGSEDEDVLVGGAGDDRIDGDEARDLIFGDNVSLDRRGAYYLDYTNPRYRTLLPDEEGIYGEEVGINDGETLEDGTHRLIPNITGTPAWEDWEITLMDHSFAVKGDPQNKFGDDYIAGGENNDTIFGQLGHDTIQGDGSIDLLDDQFNPYDAAYARNPDGTLNLLPSVEATTDGDDYIEGNGGDDLIFGNLGQDDIVGGSSDLFSLTDRLYRPDGSDIIFGGAGTDIDRNDIGDATLQDAVTTDVGDDQSLIVTDPTGHARDADMILGDNGNIYRLVEVVGTSGDPKLDATEYLEFNYDQTTEYENRGPLRIIPRAAELLDYTPGGPDYNPGAAADDIGDNDEIRGESGDDFIYGMVGDDVLFGDGQDDDLIGGWGHDWISGGTGQDGVIGDDGRIYTSRNNGVEELNGEPLNNIAPLETQDKSKYPDGDVLDEFIKTPGNIQQAVINRSGELKKTVNITPFSFDPDWGGLDDEYPGEGGDTPWADDIIFGGLGTDFLHGGSGDDAISGAEALQ